MLNGDDIILIALVFETGQIGQQFLLEHPEIAGMDPENRVAGHIMFGPIGQHAFSRRRLPPEQGRFIETDERPMAVSAHVQVFHAQIMKIVVETPGNAVHIVLHGGFDIQTEVPEPAQGPQRGGQSLFVGQFIEIEIHAGDFDPALAHPFQQAFDLGGGAASQVFVHRP